MTPNDEAKVAVLCMGGTIGGAERVLLDLLELGVPGHRHRVVLGAEGPLAEAIDAIGLERQVVALPPRLAQVGDAQSRGGVGLAARLAPGALAAVGHVRRLKKALAGSDVVHSIDQKAHAFAALAAPKGRGVVWHFHDDLSRRPAMSKALKALARWRRPGPLVVAVSEATADDARATLGPGTKVLTALNGVDLDRFAPREKGGAGAELDRACGWDEAPLGTVRVGLVATFARWKGHEDFLKAIAQLPRDLNARFYVVGGPIYKTRGSQYDLGELRGLAETLGVADRVGWAGHWAEPEPAYRGLDVVVHASTRPEPFGRTIAEGMACGKAVIATGTGGSAELFEPGVSALAIGTGGPDALAESIARCVQEDGLRERLGRAARERAVAAFDRRRLPEAWRSAYALARGGGLR